MAVPLQTGGKMNLRFGQFQIQTRRTRFKKKKAQHKNCRQCGSKNLLTSGPDQFCCDCDWHSCFEYVDKGYMNNLHFAYCEHFPKEKSQKKKVIVLPRGNAPIEQEPISTESENKKSA